MQYLPTLGKSRRRGPAPALIAVLCVAVLGIFFWRRHSSAPPPAPPKPIAVETPAAPSPTPTPQALRPSPAEDPLAGTGLKRLAAVVEGPLETSIVKEIGPEVGRPLTQVVVRALVWWIAVPNDLRRGDKLEVLYAGEGDDLHLEAIRFTSEKLGKTLRAYRYQPEGEKFARLYVTDVSGSVKELELRLSDAPLDEYEQVTSLLRDGRGHQGVDFKTPMGSPVKAPFEGEIGRINWHWKMNGNSVELKEGSGRHRTALFLHLSEVDVKTGAHVNRGQVIAKSGNTGHSFAPHLHYQLMSSDNKLLDPFNDPNTSHRSLPAPAREGFESAMNRLDNYLEAH